MKTFNNIEEFNEHVNEDGNFVYDGDIKLNFDLVFDGDVNARDIYACDIKAFDINACDIDVGDINARDINVWNINACDIKACDIYACDIKAFDIDADNINYYAVCFAHHTFKCKSIKGMRGNSKHFCLDSEIEIKGNLKK